MAVPTPPSSPGASIRSIEFYNMTRYASNPGDGFSVGLTRDAPAGPPMRLEHVPSAECRVPRVYYASVPEGAVQRRLRRLLRHCVELHGVGAQ